ncbi:mRNA-degrading endonuclease RelE of RelBE toxin-antitoxin system [Rahnella sp. BIGb0603]|uniref:type II toxin-antitoxin system RelE/ParE family toxin n=1 Tax=Rahnella sp. BIGb0603 TaxID=2940612 RepID=UPI002167EE05|nr:type II toxin-antitoxin system RelE/ParE family toxin [Rahnella sp. BIGb0603]MCS3424638.1 mRNA-degrading endonuclease RelE of RelBE toxin-antitoxin system [Rahnella sp. BIGb0603]
MSTDEIASFQTSQGNDALKNINAVLDEFEAKVKIFPLSCPVAPDLAALGIIKYREGNTFNGYRIIYTYDEPANLISVYVLLSQRQNVQELLFKKLNMG